MSRKKMMQQAQLVQMLERRRLRIQLSVGVILVVIIGLSVLFPTIHTTTRTFDDDQYFYSNQLVQHPSWASANQFIGEVLTPSTVNGYYQPLSMISLMLDVAMGASESNLEVFHLTSLLLHICNGILVFLILYVLFKRIWPAWFASILFVCHPMVIETITWIGERKTTLAAFFGLWTILLYLLSVRTRKSMYRWIALCTFVLALMAKPTVLALPIGLLILDIWPLERMNWHQWKRNVIEKIPFFFVMLISGTIAYLSQQRTSGTMTPDEQGGYVTIFYKLSYNIVLYLKHLIYPIELTSHYPIPDPFNLSNQAVLWTCLIALIIVGLITLSLKYTKALFIGFAYFIVIILPASGIIGFNNVIGSDKYAYFPMFGYLMIVCWLMIRTYDMLIKKLNRTHVTRGIIATIPVGLLIAPLVVLNGQYTEKWKNTETYYTYMLQFAPKAAPLYYDLAMEFTRQKRQIDAIQHYELAAKYSPEINRIWTNLGISYFDAGLVEKSIAAFNKALEIEPNDALAANNLGILYMKKNDDVNALSWFIKAVKIKPDFFDALFYQGKMYDKLGMMDLAMGSFQQAYQLNPGVPELHFDMGRMFEKKGMTEQALAMFQQVKQMQPDFPGIDEKIRTLTK